MTPNPLATATLLALAMTTSAADTELTIYSGDFDAVASSLPGRGMSGFALVREGPRFDLAKGDNTLTLSGLPAAIDAAGVRFVPASGDLSVSAQRFDFALADQSELLRRALGQRVTVEQAIGSSRESYTGTLLATGDGLTLALDDGRVRVLSSYASFELAALPDGLQARPTLRWSVRSPRAASERFSLDYPTAGLAWRAEYLASVSGQGDACRMDFSGAAQVLNRSGASFPDAQLTLVAGDPNLQRDPQPQMMAKSMRVEMAMAAAPPPPPQGSGEYHAYRLAGRTSLPDGSVQRVPLLADAKGVRCARRYESPSPIEFYSTPTPIVHREYGPGGVQPVLAMFEFDNKRDSGLGLPLPAGRLRVFLGKSGGREDFLGEAALGHTAAGNQVRAALGEAFDLSLERTREDFTLDASSRQMSERFALVARNAKAEAVSVRVIETLPRWSDWDITEASLGWTRLDAQRIAFDVPVPAQGEATVRYTVRYRWPDTIKF
jgi:hypothetical protein